METNESTKTINLDYLRQVLAANRNIKQTFRLDLSAQSVADAMAMIYQTLVEERCGEFELDEATEQSIKKVAEWLTHGKRCGLMMAGYVGNGKTTMLRTVARLFSTLNLPMVENNYHSIRSVNYVSALDMTRIASDPQQKNYLDGIKKCPMLAIDDVGTEPTTIKNYGNEVSPLTEVLYYRYDSRLWTMMTSNLKVSDFQERYGARIADRIREMFNVLAYNHQSYRR